MEKARKLGDKETERSSYQDIFNYLRKMKRIFGEDFYLEIPPSASEEQIIVNQKLYQIAHLFNIKIEISCDSHYSSKEERYIHKSFLNSKGGEREVDSFYEYAYLQDTEEVIKNLKASFGEFAEQVYEECYQTSIEIYNKIEEYDLRHPQTIPSIEVPDTPIEEDIALKNYPNLYKLKLSSNKIERFWVNECLTSLKQKEIEGKVDITKEEEYLQELEKEADIKRTVGEKLKTNIFAYPIVLKHYIDLIWDCGSTIGAGRGSAGAGLNHWLLGITQYDPLKLNLPFERYMNWDTTGLPDIDFDLCGSKRNLIIQKVKKERGQRFYPEIGELAKNNLGCTLIATFGTASTKRAIQIACSGYRSENYPDGIDVDTSQYLSSLIPQERGFLWNLSDTYYGNKEKGRKPQIAFINAVNEFEGLIDIAFGIEGLIVSRSSHASGVILFDEDPYKFGCFMKTPNGDIITQYDLEDAEAAGLTKYDWLITSVQDKITETILLLQKYNKIDNSLTLREVYNKYLTPEVLNFKDKKVWEEICKRRILDLFQFDSIVGGQGIKKTQPDTLNDLSNTNGVIRLMAEDGKESPLDKFVRYKNNISLWYKEMKNSGLTEEEMHTMEKYMLKSHGVAISQECIMWSLMDEKICGFTLKEANTARKIISKKKMNELPALKEKVLSKATSPAIGQYEWEYVIMPSAGYGFSDIHSIFYSMIGFQTACLATYWDPIFWNTACLIVNSGSLNEAKEEIVNIYEKEDYENYIYEDLPDRSGKKKIERTTDYSKLAKAIGDITSRGIKVSLIDINKSNFTFEPDEEKGEILFGLKGVNKIGDAVIDKIIERRPYKSIKDFMMRCPLNKTQMISLIKAGAFDKIDNEWASKISFEPRYAIMAYYLSIISEPKKKINLQNFNGLLNNDLIPAQFTEQKKTFLFNKALKETCKNGKYYILNDKLLTFYSNYYDIEKIDVINGIPCLSQSVWEKIYKDKMSIIKEWLKDNQEEVLDKYNEILFQEAWNKYATGNISAWEMESVCFYHHPHELANVNNFKYGIVNFFNLSEISTIDYFFKRGEHKLPIYKLSKIAGTVLNKNNSKSSISILTVYGVVTVKFSKEYFAMFNRQLSEIQLDGSKKVVEKGWFIRGTKLLITGYRREDTFVAKTYKNTNGHQLYKINSIDEEGNITIEHKRMQDL